LLYRDSRGVEITPAGQKLLQHARVIMRQVDHLKHDFQEQSDGDAGHIRIFANTTAVTEFMPDILAQFLSVHPGVTVDLQERLTRDIVRGVLDGTTDLGIVAGPVDAPELQAIHFSTDRLVLVVPNGHPLQDQDKVKLVDAVRYPFITMHEGSTLVAFLRDQLERGGQRLPQRIQLYSFDSICRMVQAGVGIGVIPDSAARRYGADTKLRVVELDEPWVVRERKLLVRDIDALPGCARDLIEQIQTPRKP
jgi:DNA-binding transcriptional LysR family regulator